MISVSKIDFPLSLIIGTAKLALLHSRPLVRYENGKPTDDVIGTTYEVVQVGGDFEKFNVKVLDLDTAITEKEIKESKEQIYVDFDNAVCKLYTDSAGRIQVSVKADSINVL